MKITREVSHKKKKAARIVAELKKLFPKASMALSYRTNWELLVAVMLSAQCTDKKVNEVTRELFKKYKTLDDYVRANRREFEKDIRSTGFYKNKAKNILASAKIIKERYGGRLPKTMEEMLELPGVARKTANVVLGNAYGIVLGIAVDTHVMRLSRRFGLSEGKNAQQVERDLMEILPKKEWFRFTYLMIEYGRQYCSARSCPPDHPLFRFDA